MNTITFLTARRKSFHLVTFWNSLASAARASLYPMSNGGSIRSKLPVEADERESSQENLNFLLFAACRYRDDERLKVSRRHTRGGGWGDEKWEGASFIRRRRCTKKRKREGSGDIVRKICQSILPTLCQLCTMCIVHNKMIFFLL